MDNKFLGWVAILAMAVVIVGSIPQIYADRGIRLAAEIAVLAVCLGIGVIGVMLLTTKRPPSPRP